MSSTWTKGGTRTGVTLKVVKVRGSKEFIRLKSLYPFETTNQALGPKQ